ncbi:hypothetical protein [Streptomyces poonensis]|uniref:NlpC/P60 domain-containing protein n=1 Tax=Streptomyces poonensis TaxID=68255 RepID=A0A918PZ50_9ACTN|nr:hypothetical protein [Streptomyces poonensis]GGZ28008.1 hypothetical protein GCM10010365_55430 [Streptomyces poonensis]GLJ89773.1 hypothetical protein GCM10017589_23740 [Streptomyces poonensis]
MRAPAGFLIAGDGHVGAAQYGERVHDQTGQAVSYALCFGYRNTTNHYRARLSFLTSGTVELRVEKVVENAVSELTDAAVSPGSGPPAAAQLQPGDLVLFNADSGDDWDKNGTIRRTTDHVGIYLGPDAAGKRRFLSSRKTVNGPSMADLGGASFLDGTGTYAMTLHTVRRG